MLQELQQQSIFTWLWHQFYKNTLKRWIWKEKVLDKQQVVAVSNLQNCMLNDFTAKHTSLKNTSCSVRPSICDLNRRFFITSPIVPSTTPWYLIIKDSFYNTLNHISNMESINKIVWLISTTAEIASSNI